MYEQDLGALQEIIRQKNEEIAKRDARIAELERQLAMRTGRVHSANRQIDAVLQASVSVSDDSRLWA